ncbi:U32 family peptidase [Berryella wangjianweii]|uniref:U32 family peptidase n=1 Tax=Berryella wangjianweii TaxID=2734634 RepID=A0A6M8J211_9ACTN|nr:peptidase U32 family protein [Berryella wangjianweii]QKF07141.1 U32 family peptidase [Berryella wangjianweii]
MSCRSRNLTCAPSSACPSRPAGFDNGEDRRIVPDAAERGAVRGDGSSCPVPELLAPAGGRSQLEAAVRFGADAVFLAADRFGMRARASNFPLDQLPDAVAYAHAAGVKVHATLNILMHDRDIRALPAYVEALAAAGVDAFIVSDLGALSVIQRHAPRAELHVSTQASVMNAEAARMWHQLGAARVVCARELSLDDIAELRARAPRDLKIEAFVHGAMCMAYSGRCLLSAGMTGRSGNKGACAQSCRWGYALVEEKRPGEYFPVESDEYGTYVMNAEDLCMVEHLDALRAAGVDALKIEGRNKQAFYVATVVGAYRRALDGGSARHAAEELRRVSHRPYGTGFYFGRPRQSAHADGYVRRYLHAATVERCRPSSSCGDSRGFEVIVRCQNRFVPTDELEALTPGREPFALQPRDLQLLMPVDGRAPFVERRVGLDEALAQGAWEHVAVANRASEHYRFIAPAPLQPGDFLRVPASS